MWLAFGVQLRVWVNWYPARAGGWFGPFPYAGACSVNLGAPALLAFPDASKSPDTNPASVSLLSARTSLAPLPGSDESLFLWSNK